MNRVRGFHQDKDGFIWIYTWDGLSRYEGYRFRNYIAGRDLQHSFVNDILEVPDGTLYLPLNDGNIAVIRNQEVAPQGQNPGVVINGFFRDDKERIFAATDRSGIGLFENGKFTPLASNLPVMSLLQVIFFQDHFFFIGPYTGPSGVYDKNMKLVSAWHGPPGFYNYIYKDHRNRIFVCTKAGLKQVDYSSSPFKLKTASIIPHDASWKNWNINSIIATPENDYWIATDQGLVHLRADQSWSVMTVQDGLLSNQISSLFLDRSNTLWIGTDAGAASINLQTQITNNRDLEGVFTNFVLPSQDGSVYALTGNAFLSQVDKQMNTIRSAYFGKQDNPPFALLPDHHAMLLVRPYSIEKLNPILIPFQQADPVSNSLRYTKLHDKYWFTSDYGFQCGSYPGTSNFVLDTSYNATSIAPARGDQLLIGTLGDGLILARPYGDLRTCILQKIKDFSTWVDDPLEK